MKKCSKCGINKELDQFSIQNNNLKSRCKSCCVKASQNYYATTEGLNKRRDWMYRRKYGITLDIYDSMRLNQDNKCAICNRLCNDLHVDHDHSTLKIRGLICHNCNVVLGLVYDDISILKAAIAYLEKEV